MAFDLDPAYKQVPERIADFKDKYPNGCLRPANPAEPYTVLTIDGKWFIVYVAAAYRTPDDPLPGIGSAWEPFPGTTPYTRNSELQNAETSAWGRAIVAVLASESKAVASAEDVRNRAAEEDAGGRRRRAPRGSGGGGQGEPSPGEAPATGASSGAPCSLCGSTRAQRVDVRGVWRCQQATACKQRQEERDQTPASAPQDGPTAPSPPAGGAGEPEGTAGATAAQGGLLDDTRGEP